MKKDEIKSVALSMFAANGYSGCSIQDIADKVGINKATLYFYFKSKADIFQSILSEHAKLYADSVRSTIEANADQPLEIVLYKVAKTFFDISTTERLLLWKNALLRIIGNADDDVWKASREIVYEQNSEISTSLRSLLSSKSKSSKAEQVKFISTYYLFIQSLTDWLLLNNYTMKNEAKIDFDYLWSSFLNGSRIE